MTRPEKAPVIELIARGLWLHRGRLLLCQNRRVGHVFLPGGHVEFGETAADALRRELREELGVDARVASPLATVEACFRQVSDRKARSNDDDRHEGRSMPGRTHHEINLIFQLTPGDSSSGGRGGRSGGASGGRRSSRLGPPTALPGSDEVAACESHLRFFWCPVESVLGRRPEVLVLPRVMPRVLAALLTRRSGAWRVVKPAGTTLWRDWDTAQARC